MVLSRSLAGLVVAASIACASSVRVEPLPEALASRNPEADAAAAFANGDARVLGYQSGLGGVMTPGVARSDATWLARHHGVRFVNPASSDVIREPAKPSSDSARAESAAMFAALGDYLLRYNTAMMGRRAPIKP